MLCVHLRQHWLNLPDFACEEALHESNVLHNAADIIAELS